MYITCLFIERRKNEGPELLLAWDEYSIEENPEGFREACTKTLSTLQGEFIRQQLIELDINDQKLEQALNNNPTIKASVIDED